MIRPATPEDAGPIAAIYNHYIEQTVVTFEEAPVAADEMRRRLEAHLPDDPWLVAETDG